MIPSQDGWHPLAGRQRASRLRQMASSTPAGGRKINLGLIIYEIGINYKRVAGGIRLENPKWGKGKASRWMLRPHLQESPTNLVTKIHYRLTIIYNI
jgi:hypothetical protein